VPSATARRLRARAPGAASAPGRAVPGAALPAAVAAGLAGAYVLLRLAVTGEPLGAFAQAGAVWVDPSAAPADLPLGRDRGGYDGQFMYRLALDPLTTVRTDFGIRLDNPPYRTQRVGYPTVGWLLSRLGLPVSAALVLINVAATGVLGWLGGRFAAAAGRTPMWGVCLALLPATGMALARDTAEVVGLGLLAGGLLLWRSGRWWPAAPVFTAAVLTRETTALAVVGLLAAVLITARGSGRWRPVLPLAVPLVVLAGWQLYLRSVWGLLPAGTVDAVGPPFGGVVEAVRHDLRVADARALRELAELAGLAVTLAGGLLGLPRSVAVAGEKAALVLAAGLMSVLSIAVLNRDESFSRGSAEASALAVIVLLGVPARWAGALLLLAPAGWLAAVGFHLG
jgi:hypothetical protein